MQAPIKAARSRTKYYINYEKEVRECGKCHKILPFFDFYIEKSGYPQTICKSCKNILAKAHYHAKKK